MKRTPPKPVKFDTEQIQAIESAVFAMVESHLDPRFHLLDTVFEKEAGAWFLRIYVEGHEAPVSLDDCEQISREVDPLVDTLPQLAEVPYSLEISSPGVFRPLKKQREFDFYAGRPVRVETVPEAKPNRKGPVPRGDLIAEGTLQGFNPADNTVTLLRPGSDTPVEVPLGDRTTVLLNPEVHFPDDEDV